MGVLRILNVAPMQMHPNSRASLQVFQLVCEMFDLHSFTQVFLHYYSAWPIIWLVGCPLWVIQGHVCLSLIPRPINFLIV